MGKGSMEKIDVDSRVSVADGKGSLPSTNGSKTLPKPPTTLSKAKPDTMPHPYGQKGGGNRERECCPHRPSVVHH